MEDTAQQSEARDPITEAAEKFLKSHVCEISLSGILAFNMFLVIKETDADGKGEVVELWVSVALSALVIIYTGEIALRMLVARGNFFHDGWNVMDLIVVGIDIFFIALGVVGVDTVRFSILRLCRFVKLARAYRMLLRFPELHLMMRGLSSALRSMFWGLVLIVIVLILWSIIAVSIIQPLNEDIAANGTYDGCDRCPRAFESVFQSFLTFTQQILAGDSWGAVSVPIIEAYPWTAFYFMAVMVSIQLVMLNLILASICDAAQEARKGTMHELAMEKEKRFHEARDLMIQMCQEIDIDKSGHLTLQELEEGCNNHSEFRDVLTVMDVKGPEIPIVFKIMDVDCSGDVDYKEFVEELHRMKSHDSQTLLVFIKHYVTEIRQKLEEQIRLLGSQLQEDLMCGGKDIDPIKRTEIRAMSEREMRSPGKENKARETEPFDRDSVERHGDGLAKEILRLCNDISLKHDDNSKMLSSMHDCLLAVADKNFTSLALDFTPEAMATPTNRPGHDIGLLPHVWPGSACCGVTNGAAPSLPARPPRKTPPHMYLGHGGLPPRPSSPGSSIVTGGPKY